MARTRSSLRTSPRRHGIGDSIAFQKLIHALFPATPSTATAVDGSPTTTTADGPKPWRFDGARLEVVRSQFAVGVSEAICKAPARCGNGQFSTRTTTGSVWMDFPSVGQRGLHPVAGYRGRRPFREGLVAPQETTSSSRTRRDGMEVDRLPVDIVEEIIVLSQTRPALPLRTSSESDVWDFFFS